MEYNTLAVSTCSDYVGEHRIVMALQVGWKIKHIIENMDIDICGSSTLDKRTVKGCLIILERPKNG